jgi:transcriptional regulator with XRE-family HTH domain
MGPAQIKECMTLLGWSASTLADQLGCGRAIVVQWINGTSAHGIPPAIADWIIRRADAAIPLPPPIGWRTRTGRQSYDQGWAAAD